MRGNRSTGVQAAAAFLLLVCAFTSTAAAVSYDVIVRNAYTFDALDSASVTLEYANGTTAKTEATDSTGLAHITGLAVANYTATASRAGYNTESWGVDLNETKQLIVYMTYVSESMVRLRYADMTGRNRPACFYDIDSGRLMRCYTVNDTVMLSAGNYTVYVGSGLLESASNPANMLYTLMSLVPAVLAGGFILMAGFGAGLIVLRLARRVMR